MAEALTSLYQDQSGTASATVHKVTFVYRPERLIVFRGVCVCVCVIYSHTSQIKGCCLVIVPMGHPSGKKKKKLLKDLKHTCMHVHTRNTCRNGCQLLPWKHTTKPGRGNDRERERGGKRWKRGVEADSEQNQLCQ